MRKIKDFIIKNRTILIIIVLIAVELSIPLFTKGIFIGDDYEYHLARIDSIAKSLANGQFPVKIHYIMANTYGYGSGLFYSNFFLYIPAVLENIGFSLITAYEIFVALMFVLFVIISYISLKEITGEEKSALIGTIIVTLSNCIITNVYYRFALGEFLGYIFILPVIAGIYNYVNNNFDKPYYIIIGFCGLLFSHIITTFLVIGFCLIYFLIYIKSTIKNPKKFLKLIISAIIVIFLTAIFWMPMIEQYFSQDFRLSKPWTNISGDTYGVYDLFGKHKYNVGYMIIFFLPFVLYSIISKKVDKKYKIYGILAIAIIGLLAWKGIWKYRYISKIANLLQFKFRLIGPITILTGISIAGISESLKSKINLKYVLIIILVLSSLCVMNYYKKLSSEKAIRVYSLNLIELILYNNANSIGGGQEYLPINCDYTYFQTPNKAMYSSREQIDVEKNGLTCEFTKDKEGKDFVDMPLVYYKGYCAEMVTENNETIQLDVAESEIGFVRVNVPEEKGKVKVYYKSTVIQKISYILSLITFICVIAYCPIKKYFFNRNKK